METQGDTPRRQQAMSLYGGMTDTENITEDITKQTDALMTGRGTGGVRRDTAGNEKS